MSKNVLEVRDLKDMLNKTRELYGDRPGYKIKLGEENYKTYTHSEIRDMVNYLGTALISLGLKNKRIAVINLIGRTSMGILSENPFIVANDIYNKLKNQVDIFVLDFHAEATAEKIAMGYYMDGKYTIVYGTHTHVQTADEQILEKGTAYITDVGMTGPKKSVIGMDVGVSFKRFVTSLPERYKLADSEAMINGCVFKINDETNRTEEIIRINKK